MSATASCCLFVFGVLCCAAALIFMVPKKNLTHHYDASTLDLSDGAPVAKWEPLSDQIAEMHVYGRPLTWAARYDAEEYLYKKLEIHRPWSSRRCLSYIRRHFFSRDPIPKYPSDHHETKAP